jgi:hypothetical protein
VVDTSSDDSEFVEQNEIQDVPLKHRTPRKSARGARVRGAEAPPLAGELSSLSSSAVGSSRSLPSSLSRAHH